MSGISSGAASALGGLAAGVAFSPDPKITRTRGMYYEN
jgi:hypothetical protein